MEVSRSATINNVAHPKIQKLLKEIELHKILQKQNEYTYIIVSVFYK